MTKRDILFCCTQFSKRLFLRAKDHLRASSCSSHWCPKYKRECCFICLHRTQFCIHRFQNWMLLRETLTYGTPQKVGSRQSAGHTENSVQHTVSTPAANLSCGALHYSRFCACSVQFIHLLTRKCLFRSIKASYKISRSNGTNKTNTRATQIIETTSHSLGITMPTVMPLQEICMYVYKLILSTSTNYKTD